jgi:hypothetical protein
VRCLPVIHGHRRCGQRIQRKQGRR